MPPLILLAAGRSSRMGEPKALLDYGGRPWVEAQLERFRASGGEVAALVLGAELERHRSALPWLPEEGRVASFCGLRVRRVQNPRPERGQLSSLQEGLRALGEPSPEGAWASPIDVPLSPAALGALRGRGGPAPAWIPCFGGRGGHPIWLSRGAIEGALALDPEVDRLDRFLRERGALRVEVEDPTVILDLDTKEEWRRWCAATLLLQPEP